MKRRLLIAGGTGLIGTAIRQQAEKDGWEVLLLSRRAGASIIRWDPVSEWIDLTQPMDFDAIINLAGSSLAEGRWTSERMRDIRDSRKQAASTLEKYLADGMLRTSVYIGASAIGVYGNHGDKLVNEDTPVGYGLDWLADTVIDWEAAHQRIERLGIRTLMFRIGLVLSRQGGALKAMLRLHWMGIIPYFGSGKQLWSWIHIDDLADLTTRAVRRLSENERNGLSRAVALNARSRRMPADDVGEVGVALVGRILLGNTQHG